MSLSLVNCHTMGTIVSFVNYGFLDFIRLGWYQTAHGERSDRQKPQKLHAALVNHFQCPATCRVSR